MYLDDWENNIESDSDLENKESNSLTNDNLDISSDISSDDSVEEYEKPFFHEITNKYLLGFLYLLLVIYTDLQLYFKELFYPDKPKISIDEIKLLKSKSEYNYYKNNKIIATSDSLTNRKNYDFALCEHDTNIDEKYTEIILCYNKIKKRNISICEKHFISIYFTIDENDYEIKFNENNFNIYLTGNIVDYNIINYIMLDKFNVNISNVPYNLILIDNDSSVVELKETECIRFYKNRYVVGKYD